MKYVMTSKDDIFYEKYIVKDTIALKNGQIEIDKATYLTVKLPCKLIDMQYVTVDEYPDFGFVPSVMEPEPAPEPTPQEDTDAMLVDHEYRMTMLELGLEVTNDAV